MTILTEMGFGREINLFKMVDKLWERMREICG